MTHEPATRRPLLVSYLTLRKAIGWMGMGLPVVLAIGGPVLGASGIQSSMSAYYYTDMRDVFVGVLCAIGVFLMSYKGYDRHDDLASTVAGVSAAWAALLPTAPAANATALDRLVGLLHFTFSGLFLVTLALMSLLLFTKTDKTKEPTPMKLRRNRVFRVCGWTILAAVALIPVVKLGSGDQEGGLESLRPVFWLEVIAVVAFGVSWLTKGEGILKDE